MHSRERCVRLALPMGVRTRFLSLVEALAMARVRGRRITSSGPPRGLGDAVCSMFAAPPPPKDMLAALLRCPNKRQSHKGPQAQCATQS